MKISTLLLLFTFCLSATAQTPYETENFDYNAYYFGDSTRFDEAIPEPLGDYGYSVGEWHVRYDQIYQYMQTLSKASERATWIAHGQSYEQKPMGVLAISSASNIQNLESIRAKHIEALAKGTVDPSLPIILYQGYTVHGDESSGANAALLYAYYLTAAKSEYVNTVLNNVIVLLDPCLNPDGLDRFAHWANTNKGKHPLADPQTREHNQPWLRARTNHYWFDLNRDWLPVQHPESKGRLHTFHQFKPHVLTDHHEMGRNSTFFFQPGIPSRTNPLTGDANQEMTGRIAEFHAKRLDQIKSLYYTRESFDDFYYGKGSTYPDINGSIGILFEQASSRGHVAVNAGQEEPLHFPFTIRNQLVTSFSTLEAGFTLKSDLQAYQTDFYAQSRKDAIADKRKYLIFGHPSDKKRAALLAEVFEAHQIKVHPLGKKVNHGKKTYLPEYSSIVQLEQDQYRLILAMLQKRETFNDSLFYDISAWTLPYAFGLNYDFLSAGQFTSDMIGRPSNGLSITASNSNTAYACLVRWNDYMSPAFLYHIQKEGQRAKFAESEFSVHTIKGNQTFAPGTLLIKIEEDAEKRKAQLQILREASSKYKIALEFATTGMTKKGMDLGSNGFLPVRMPKVLLVAGEGASMYDAGEVWHLLDQKMDIPVSIVEFERLNSVDLSAYNVIIMADGYYNGNGGTIKKWVQSGGTLIAMRGALSWAEGNKLTDVRFKSKDDPYEVADVHAYAHLGNARGAQVIGGAIVEVNADLTHPLLFGYDESAFPIFQRGTQFIEPLQHDFVAPLHYAKKPLLSGYVSDENLKLMSKTPALWVDGGGSGQVVCFNFNPNFRAFWYGTNKLFLNAVFFSDQLRWDARND